MTEIRIGDKVFKMRSGIKLEEDEKRNPAVNKIPFKYQNIKMDDFILTQFNKKIITGLNKYSKSFVEHKDKSILITGGVGTGKTMLSCLLIKNVLELGLKAELITTIDMLDKIRDSYNPAVNSEIAYIDKICNTDLLILDDIGTEKLTEWAYEKIYKVINHRYNKNRAIVFTTNCTLEQLRKVFDERLTSRIVEMTKGRMFNLQGDDWRMK